MRIGVIHWGFPPVVGGVEMHLLTICPEMVRQGAEVFVLTGTYEDAPLKETVQGVHVTRSDLMVPSNITKRADNDQDLYTTSERLFSEFVQEHRIDVVHAHNLHYDFLEYGKALSNVCQEKRIPHVLVLHNDHFEDPETEEITQRIVSDIRWTRLVAISQYIKSSVSSIHPGIPDRKWVVIPHGIDLDTFRPVEVDEKERLKHEYGFDGRKVILHPGRIIPWKGIIPTIKAMPSVIEMFPEALLVLTGRAKVIFQGDQVVNYNRQVDALIEELEVVENVHIGSYAYEDIPLLTALADVLIYTSVFDEPFGLCPVEGMACAVPVIVTRSGGMIESVVDGETGFIIDNDEERIPSQLADRICRVLGDQRLALQLGNSGRQRAETFFVKGVMAQALIELSREVRAAL